MTDTQMGIIIAAMTTLIAGFAAFVKWLINRAPEKEDVTNLTLAVKELTSTTQEVSRGFVRLEATFNAILDERERTPRPHDVREFNPVFQDNGSSIGSEDDTPPLKPKPRTPIHGVPYGPFNPSKKR